MKTETRTESKTMKYAILDNANDAPPVVVQDEPSEMIVTALNDPLPEPEWFIAKSGLTADEVEEQYPFFHAQSEELAS